MADPTLTQTLPDPTPVASNAVLSMLGRLACPLWVFDIDESRVHWANAAALDVWQAGSLADLQARPMGADMSASVALRLRQFQQDFERRDCRFAESWTLYPGGQPRTLEVQFSGMRLPDGRMAMLCEVLGEQRVDSRTLRSAEALLHTSVMITLYDLAGRALYRNGAARDAVADPDRCLTHHFADPGDLDSLLAEVARSGEARRQSRVHTADGERWHDVAARSAHDAVTGVDALLLSEVDISELKRTEAHARYLAFHDTLTGLPNRHFVNQHFPQRLHTAQAQGHEAALLFIDLDHFKDVNDALGHAVGDELLVKVADRLRMELQPGDVAARLGGDEFLVLLTASAVKPRAQALGERLLTALSGAIEVDRAEVRVTPTIGGCLSPRDGTDLDTLMRHADLAMYRAKALGRHRLGWFSPEMNIEVRARLALESELRSALVRREFELYYQPRLSVATGQVVGAEALVRWHHPERGLVAPAVFIPACEDIGLIGALGAQVLEEAARQQLAWRAGGLDLHVSVNLSPRQFADPHLLETVAQIVRTTGCDPKALELEITESVLLGHDNSTLNVLRALRDMGFRISIDDFGTGYSNLAYLRRYPVSVLKIDRAFIDEIHEARPITGLILGLSRALGLRVVAEGVETDAQLAWLRNHGCDEYQGNLASVPLPAAAFEALVRQQGVFLRPPVAQPAVS